MYKLFTTMEFDKDYDKLDNSLKEQIRKEIDQVQINPYAGKPLGYSFFVKRK